MFIPSFLPSPKLVKMGIFPKAKRIHDSFYLFEDQCTTPKEYFKECTKLILNNYENFSSKHKINFLDIGCAAGDFLRYFKKNSDKNHLIKYYGIDVMKKLIIEAKKRFNEGEFGLCDLSEEDSNINDVFKKSFDIITMLGVHSIFDEIFWLEKIVDALNKKGIAIVWGSFNPYPYDLIMRVKRSGSDNYEPGWNVHSKTSMIKECNKLGVKCEFYDFEPDITLPRNMDDGLRSWSFKIGKDISEDDDKNPEIFEKNRSRIFTNATRIIHDFSFCLIYK